MGARQDGLSELTAEALGTAIAPGPDEAARVGTPSSRVVVQETSRAPGTVTAPTVTGIDGHRTGDHASPPPAPAVDAQEGP